MVLPATMIIRESNDPDSTGIMKVNKEAFNSDLEGKIVFDLFSDPSAKPLLSLIAIKNDETIGHILFTKCTVKPHADASIYLLAPMSVLPSHQRAGVGGALIKRGLEELTSWGVDLVFLLGHTNYYPRFGFKPAIPLGFTPTYPISEENADAWMVNELNPGMVGNIKGQVICADMLNKPEYW